MNQTHCGGQTAAPSAQQQPFHGALDRLHVEISELEDHVEALMRKVDCLIVHLPVPDEPEGGVGPTSSDLRSTVEAASNRICGLRKRLRYALDNLEI